MQIRHALLGTMLGFALTSSAAPALAALLTPEQLDQQAPVTVNRSMLSALPELDRSAFDAARQAFAKGQFEDAANGFDALRKRDAGLPPGRVVVAWMFMAQRRGPAALASLERAAVEFPEHPLVYATLGQVALSQGRLTDASLQFAHARKLPSPKGSTDKQLNALKVTFFDGLVQIAERRERWAEVKSLVSDWQATLGSTPALEGRLARAEFFLGDTATAEQRLRKATKANTNLDPAEMLIASFHRRNGDFDATTRWLKDGVAAHPDDHRVLKAYGDWLLTMGDAAEAVKLAQRAAKAGSDKRLTAVLTGLAAHQLGRYEAAELVFAELNRQSPADVQASDRLALALAEQPEEAKRSRGVQLAEINARQYSRNSEVLSTLGWTYFRSGRINEAERALRAAARLGSLTPDAAYFLAAVLAYQNKGDEARAYLDSALEKSNGIRFLYRKQATDLKARL